MSIWLEVFLVWITIGTVLNLAAYTVFHKRGYFKWLNDVHDILAYHIGYEDAQKEMRQEIGATVYDGLFNSSTKNVSFSQLREYGVKDTRYKE